MEHVLDARKSESLTNAVRDARPHLDAHEAVAVEPLERRGVLLHDLALDEGGHLRHSCTPKRK